MTHLIIMKSVKQMLYTNTNTWLAAFARYAAGGFLNKNLKWNISSKDEINGKRKDIFVKFN